MIRPILDQEYVVFLSLSDGKKDTKFRSAWENDGKSFHKLFTQLLNAPGMTDPDSGDSSPFLNGDASHAVPHISPCSHSLAEEG